MVSVLHVTAALLVAVGMGLSLAHALEFPGKKRLGRDSYVAVQSIYYPGFTIGGLFGEFGAMLATLALLVAMPKYGVAFWLTVAGFVALLVMHGLYWVMTHPVNKFWLKDMSLAGAGAAFFSVGGSSGEDHAGDDDWIALRDRWEYSHAARAAAGMIALVLLLVAAVV